MKMQGAEAEVEILDSRVLKTRKSKKYRHPRLDKNIIRERTENEVRNMERAILHGVNVPEAEKKDANTIQIQKIKGEAWKVKEDTNLMERVGHNVAKMHDCNLIHGDLTTSNILIQKEEAFLIDFGLSEVSERVEDKAVDIHLLKQVLGSSHPEISGEAWEKFLEGYREYDYSDEVLERLEEVEQRGRYK